jgi:hypothetical protein
VKCSDFFYYGNFFLWETGLVLTLCNPFFDPVLPIFHPFLPIFLLKITDFPSKTSIFISKTSIFPSKMPFYRQKRTFSHQKRQFSHQKTSKITIFISKTSIFISKIPPKRPFSPQTPPFPVPGSLEKRLWQEEARQKVLWAVLQKGAARAGGRRLDRPREEDPASDVAPAGERHRDRRAQQPVGDLGVD